MPNMNDVMIASTHDECLTLWKQGLRSFADDNLLMGKLVDGRLQTLIADVNDRTPQILLLDIRLIELDGSYNIIALRRLCSGTKTIVMTGDIAEDLEWKLLKAGIRGCCRNDIEPELLKQVVKSVKKGELWIRRTLTSRLIDELGNGHTKIKTHQSALGLLNRLTQREYEIAVRVGKGECNKQIAQECDITERTVKAHLTEIFIKMGVTDRLNLALVLAADNGNNNSNYGNPLVKGTPVYELNPSGDKEDLSSRLVA